MVCELHSHNNKTTIAIPREIIDNHNNNKTALSDEEIIETIAPSKK